VTGDRVEGIRDRGQARRAHVAELWGHMTQVAHLCIVLLHLCGTAL